MLISWDQSRKFATRTWSQSQPFSLRRPSNFAMKSTLLLYSRNILHATVFLTLAAFVVLSSAALAGTQPMTFLDVLKLRTVSQGSLSKDGRMFAYTTGTLDWKSGKRFTDIWSPPPLMASPTRQLTFTATQNESNPQFSPDAKWLAFQSDRGSIFKRRCAGGGNGNRVQRWRPTLLDLAIWQGEAGARLAKVPVRLVPSFSVPMESASRTTQGRGEDRQLFLYDMASQKGSLRSPKHSTGVLAFAWSPDSSTIYFQFARYGRFERAQKRMELHFDVGISNPVPVPHHLWEVSATSNGSDARAHRLTSGDDVSVGAVSCFEKR